MKKQKFRSWGNIPSNEGEKNTGKSKTMPDMEINPRRVLENHVRGINPITGAVLDKGLYYGDNILPYEKDLTYEELRIKRMALNEQVKQMLNVNTGDTPVDEQSEVQGTEQKPTGDTVQTNS